MSRHLITTRVEPDTCRTCRQPVLHGYEEGYPVTADTAPIPAAAELAVLLTGARTYTLTSQHQFVLRTDWRIRSTMLHGTIHAEHYCTRISRQKAEARQRANRGTK